jgi:hypothetical protein
MGNDSAKCWSVFGRRKTLQGPNDELIDAAEDSNGETALYSGALGCSIAPALNDSLHNPGDDDDTALLVEPHRRLDRLFSGIRLSGKGSPTPKATAAPGRLQSSERRPPPPRHVEIDSWISAFIPSVCHDPLAFVLSTTLGRYMESAPWVLYIPFIACFDGEFNSMTANDQKEL